jgi:mono/diheme cytochrome c family protein
MEQAPAPPSASERRGKEREAHDHSAASRPTDRRRRYFRARPLRALSSAPATAAGDPDRGEALAKRWCAACHIVAADQARGADNVPPFATIAKMKGFSAGSVAQFLMDPHPKMPDMQLSRVESQDLGAYIASLGSK